jgi:hypothetical protein|tara:strand:- start:133 stop:318 length:186 start_codon:yes stop_codon:yes gene_type:complete
VAWRGYCILYGRSFSWALSFIYISWSSNTDSIFFFSWAESDSISGGGSKIEEDVTGAKIER